MRDKLAQVGTHAAQHGRGGRSGGIFLRVREEPQVAVVNGGVLGAVTGPFFLVMLAKRFFELVRAVSTFSRERTSGA